MDNHVIAQFGKDIPVEYHGPALLHFEKRLRQQTGIRVEVYKPSRGDDSKLRAAMTKEQRAKL